MKKPRPIPYGSKAFKYVSDYNFAQISTSALQMETLLRPTMLVAFGPGELQIYPVNHLIFAVYCANFPRSRTTSIEPDSGSTTLPLERIAAFQSVPVFESLMEYFYGGDIHLVYARLLSPPLNERKVFIRCFWRALFELEVVDQYLYVAACVAWEDCLMQFQCYEP
ncbi:hypothetical protein H0H81_000580 [Sphagnurus paluster]|uniref:Uncharacterized protein n=1 Tax=Sphagnurus paluster TaxID=117069 RepID=A0A9P7G0N6_9AGAR|nr:hypothetical protein H0H81_000580 [Sphagnurus paluster]